MNNETFRTMFRNDFLSFCRKALRKLDGTRLSKDRYIELVASRLTDFAAGRTRRLLINLGPRSCKTSVGSVCLAAWLLGRKPNTKIMILAYSEELAEQIARSVRAILRAEWYRAIFPTRIEKGHAKTMDFATTAGGGVFAASINGSITGHGADVIIVDDPHNITDAGNPEQLERTINQFNTVIKSRLNNRKTGRILVIAHRISERDLSAHLIVQGKWDHVALPLIAMRDETYKTKYGLWRRRKNELLRPDAEDEDDIAHLKKTLVNPDFDMLYQQDYDGQAKPPITPDHFPTFARGDHAHLPCMLSVDPGYTDGDEASCSVIQAWALDAKNFYLRDQCRKQCEFDELKRMVLNLNRRYRPFTILVEKTANGPALISELKRKAPHLIVPITPRGSKSARLYRHIDKIRDGRIRLPNDAEFSAEFVAEFEAFPRGNHTDQVDAFTQMADWVDQNDKIARMQRSTPPSLPMVVVCHSQFSGFDHRTLATNKPGERAVIAGRGNSSYNGPFRRW